LKSNEVGIVIKKNKFNKMKHMKNIAIVGYAFIALSWLSGNP
jgi:hypothetical protein